MKSIFSSYPYRGIQTKVGNEFGLSRSRISQIYDRMDKELPLSKETQKIARRINQLMKAADKAAVIIKPAKVSK